MDLSNAPTGNAAEKKTPLVHIPTGGPTADRKMGLRHLDVFPGGVSGLHDHSNRQAILYVLRGTMTVYDDKADAPIVVNEGESVREVGLMHYAVNNSQKDPLSLLTFDLLDDGTRADADCTGC